MKANRRALAQADDAVSDLVGSILLVGITVVLASALGVLIFSVAEPQETVLADVSGDVSPGNNGWGNGDESITFSHQGGESIAADTTVIRINIGGTITEFTGGSLGGPFADEEFTIGEEWSYTTTIGSGLEVEGSFIVENRQGGTQLLAQVSDTSDCSDDIDAPFVTLWEQDPSDLDVATPTGPVTITATLTDVCQGIDDSVPVNLYYRIGTAVPTYTLADTASITGTTWTGEIPSQTWSGLTDQLLEYYLDPLTDLADNAGPSDTQSDEISALTNRAYVSSNTDLEGTTATLNCAQSIGGCDATLTEAAQTGPTAVTQTILEAASASGSGVSGATDALTSNNVAVAMNAVADVVTVTGFTAPTDATGISSISIGFEGQREGPASSTVQVTLSYSGVPWVVVPDTISVPSGSTDVNLTTPVTGDGSWSLTHLSGLSVHVSGLVGLSGSREVFVDQIYVILNWIGPGADVHNMTIQFNIDDVLAGTGHELQIVYETSTESFEILVYDGANWNVRGVNLVPSLPTAWSYTLLPGEIISETVQFRFVDLSGTNTTPYDLLIDYARVEWT